MAVFHTLQWCVSICLSPLPGDSPRGTQNRSERGGLSGCEIESRPCENSVFCRRDCSERSVRVGTLCSMCIGRGALCLPVQLGISELSLVVYGGRNPIRRNKNGFHRFKDAQRKGYWGLPENVQQLGEEDHFH